MQIANLNDRLGRAERILSEVAQGRFTDNIEIGDNSDPLAGLEMGINFMVLDLRRMQEENDEKERVLLQKQAELEEKLTMIERQAEAIRELSTPVMEVWDDVLVLPVVGVVDTRRSLEIMDNLLARVVEHQSKCVIIDITGVEIVDTKTADYLLKVVQAAQLLGTRCVLTGINPSIAQTLVEIGADLTSVRTLRNLKAGLIDCIQHIRKNNHQTSTVTAR